MDQSTQMSGAQDLGARVEYLETELAAAAQAFAVVKRGVMLLSGIVLRQSAALEVIGPLVGALAGVRSDIASQSQSVAREIAALEKMFGESN